jgi:hypothetical protein
MRPDARPANAARRRLLRLAWQNLLIFGGALALVWLGSIVLHRPTGTEPRVATPKGMMRGRAPGPLDAGDYRLILSGASWVPQASLPADAPLSFRARPSALVDYLVLDVRLSNLGDGTLPLDYVGARQDVRLLLASADPEAFVREPLTPDEARTVSGREPLASAPLGPQERRAGVLVYAIERYRSDLRLLAVPVYATGQTPAEGPDAPALEMRFRPSN